MIAVRSDVLYVAPVTQFSGLQLTDAVVRVRAEMLLVSVVKVSGLSAASPNIVHVPLPEFVALAT